ncbi:MAG: glutaminyl-peptide cyclotransferase [Bacteroidota bacterium]
MKNRSILLIAAVALFTYSCHSNTESTGSDITISPESGSRYKAGDEVTVKVNLPKDAKPDSIVYLLDSVRFASKKDSTAVSFKTDTMPLGARVITAKFYQGGKNQDVSTNIVLMAAKAPEEMTYRVIKKYPHDTGSYTEGLLYHDGYLYESTGNIGQSALKKVDLATGKAVQIAKINPKDFGEGSAIIGDQILMLTYKQPETAYVFDKKTFKLIRTFINNVGVEGWGMTYDGKKIYFDDSTNRIWFLNKDTFRQSGFIDVYDDKGPIQQINELEYIDGKLYANVYTTDDILIIDPKTGAVLQKVNMADLWPPNQRPAGFDNNENVLNGIAWDAKGKRLFITGKKWPTLYQVEFVKK